MELHWVHEPADRTTDEQERLYEAVIAKPQPYSVAIYDGAEFDADASERDGRKRFRNVTMIAVRLMGETDFISEPLSDTHKRRFPRAWKAYQDNRERWANAIPVTALPGVGEAERMELEALGVTEVDQLAKADLMPDNLEPFRQMAIRIRKPRVRLTADGPVPI